MSVVESWRHIRHCNIVSIREAFTTRAFGDSCKNKKEKIENSQGEKKYMYYFIYIYPFFIFYIFI